MQTLQLAFFHPEVASENIDSLLGMLKLMPYIDGMNGVYDAKLVVQASDAIFKVAKSASHRAVCLMAKAYFSPDRTADDQENIIALVSCFSEPWLSDSCKVISGVGAVN